MSITNINNIPPELIKGHILPCLEPKDLSAVARVSKLWNQYANSEIVWKALFQTWFPAQTISPTPAAKEQYKIAKEEEKKEIAEITLYYSPMNIYPILQLFGGAKKFRTLPVMDLNHTTKGAPRSSIDYFKLEDLTSPIMRGKDKSGRHFLVIKIKAKGQTTASGFRCYFQSEQEANSWGVVTKNFSQQGSHFEYLTPYDAEGKLTPILKKTGRTVLAD